MNTGVLQQVSQATFTGVTVADIRTHLNITDTSTDAYIQTLIDAARVYAERYTMMDFCQTTWKLILDQFPSSASASWYDFYGNYIYNWPLTAAYPIGRANQIWQRIDLKRGPITTVDSVQYYDDSNVLQTYSSSNYRTVFPSWRSGYVEPVQYWPVAYPRPDAVVINFKSGWTTNLPAQVTHAIKMLCGLWWAMREDISYGPNTVGTSTGQGVDMLLGQVRQWGYQ